MFTNAVYATMRRKGGSKRSSSEWDDDYFCNDDYIDRHKFGESKAKKTKQKQKERREKRERLWENL